MSLDEEALGAVANGGSMPMERWADMVAPLLERLEYIVYNVFPMPKVPACSFDAQQIPPPPSQASGLDSIPPESSNKENAAPSEPQTTSVPEPTTGSPRPTERVPDSQSSESLPPPLALILNSIRSAVQTFFSEKPPHTIQRFAELILRPTAHYKTLPAYLRAVDRVISVTSSVDVFSFNTPANSGAQSNGLVHPTTSASTYLTSDYAHGLGSDESLGGALLTPIPWLTGSSFEGEDTSVLEAAEEPSVDQQEGLVAGAEEHLTTNKNVEVGTASASSPADTSDEIPHARGPPVVGVEDMGLQDGKGVEMNLGDDEKPDLLAGDGNQDSNQPVDEISQDNAEPGVADKDGDIVLEDTKPKDVEDTVERPTEGTAQPDGEQPKSTGDAMAAEPEKKE